MPSDVTGEEFQQLATRTDILERKIEGEKMVTRHILEQTRRNGADIAEIKTGLKGLTHGVDGLDRKFDGLRGEFVGLRGEFRKLREDLPASSATPCARQSSHSCASDERSCQIR